MLKGNNISIAEILNKERIIILEMAVWFQVSVDHWKKNFI